jgi:hypothetical protein
MESEISKEEFGSLVKVFMLISNFTAKVQRDISIGLVQDKTTRKRLLDDLKMSEEEMQKIMDHAVLTFVSAMPLATMNHSNLFTQAIALHSNITDNAIMHQVVEEVSRQQD